MCVCSGSRALYSEVRSLNKERVLALSKVASKWFHANKRNFVVFLPPWYSVLVITRLLLVVLLLCEAFRFGVRRAQYVASLLWSLFCSLTLPFVNYLLPGFGQLQLQGQGSAR